MYSFLITQDNSIIATERERIMEKSKLVDTLQFIVEKTYNDFDMSTFDLVMEYISPISKTVHIETLTIADNNYKDLYLSYRMPVDTNITAECGNVNFSLSFMKADIDLEGVARQYVRRIENSYIKVIPIETWFAAPDEALTQLAELYLANKQSINALQDIANIMVENSVNDIKLDAPNGELYLVHDDTKIGNGIAISDLGDEITEQTASGTVKINI